MDPGPSIPRTLELLDRSVPDCSLNVPVPWPVDQRATQLARLVALDKLGPTSKKELVAALIQAAEPSGLMLWETILRYRRATVGDAAFWVPEHADPIEFAGRERGRPAGRLTQ